MDSVYGSNREWLPRFDLIRSNSSNISCQIWPFMPINTWWIKHVGYCFIRQNKRAKTRLLSRKSRMFQVLLEITPFCHHRRHLALIKKTLATNYHPNLLTHRRRWTNVSVSEWIRLFKLLLLQVKVHLYINNYTGKGLLTSSSTLLLPQGRCGSRGRDVEGFGVMWSRCFWVDAFGLTCHPYNNLQMHTRTGTRTVLSKKVGLKNTYLTKIIVFLIPFLCKMLF